MLTRDVRVTRDHRWRFEEEGERLPFEDIAAYASSRVSDRLTPDHLFQYAQALGIPPEVDLDTSYCLVHYFPTAPEEPIDTAKSFHETPVGFDDLERPDFPFDLSVGDLLTIDQFFQPHTNEDDIGCNLGDEHPGIDTFYQILLAVEAHPTTHNLKMHVSDINENGYPYCDAVFVMTTNPDVARIAAATLAAEALTGNDMAPPPPPFNHPTPGTTTICLWWD